MTRLTWTSTREGWSSGRYRIERAAPRFWVLSKVTGVFAGTRARVTIVRSAASAGLLKHAAARLEAKRARRHGVAKGLAAATVLLTLLHIGVTSTPVLIIPSACALMWISLRAIVRWADATSDSAWAWLSQNYQ